jgi:alpha-L-rhamnosidase
VGGIRNDEEFPGYKHLLIDPQIPAGVTWANTTKETPYGIVTVKWKLNNGKFEADIMLPVGCTAEIMVPKGGADPELNGKPVETIENKVSIESGRYIFKCRL